MYKLEMTYPICHKVGHNSKTFCDKGKAPIAPLPPKGKSGTIRKHPPLLK